LPVALQAPARRVLFAGAVVAAIVLSLVLILHRPLLRGRSIRFRRRLAQIRHAIRSVSRQPHRLLFGWLLGMSCGLVLPLRVWLFAWPLAKIAAVMPITQGGIGVREAALVLLLAPFGAPAARVLATGIVWEGVIIAGGLLAGLTALYIREGFLTLGARAMETANRKISSLILLCVRIEGLQTMREELGSNAVERGLRSAAVLLKSSFRRTDFVARTGESQFAALAIDPVEPSGAVLRQRLEKRLAALHRDIGVGGPLELRISMGFWSPEAPKAFSEFLDSIEAGLRPAPLVSGEEPALRNSAPQPREKATETKQGTNDGLTVQ